MSACLPWYTVKKAATNQLARDVSQFSVQERLFSHVSLWKWKMRTYSIRTEREQAYRRYRAHHPYLHPLAPAGPPETYLIHAVPDTLLQRAGDVVSFLRWSSSEERKRSFQLCSFFLFSSLQCLPAFLVENASVAWSYSRSYWAFIAEAQHLSLFLLVATWARSSCATEKHLLNEAAMRSMLYDFQEQNSLQLAEGLVFDSFLWLFYNCLQIFSSFKLFWKVLGGSQKLFCTSMCLLAWIQESF